MNLITNNISTLKIHKMTQAQYERELAAGNIDENALYLTPDEARDLSLYLTKDEAKQEYESQISAQEKLNEAKEYAETVILAVTKEMGESKADKEHSHDGMYYTQEQIDEIIENQTVNVYRVVISGDSTSGYTADRTFADIETAINNGMIIIGEYNFVRYVLTMHITGSVITLSSASWVVGSFAQINSMEIHADNTIYRFNLSPIDKQYVTHTLDDAATQEQYPSAKAVVDYVQTTTKEIQDALDVANEAQSTAETVQATVNTKMDATNPVGTGSFSMNRKSGTTVGECSHAEGYLTTAGTGGVATAINVTTAEPPSGEYAHAEGYGTVAEGRMSHAEGNGTTASGHVSHAEGMRTTASGHFSHAEGYDSVASGSRSHAEGNETTASGNASHAEGTSTIAKGYHSHVEGMYNISDDSPINRATARHKYAHIVGNGTSDTKRSNAHTLDWDGNAWYQGDVYVGGAGQDDENAKILATQEYVDEAIAGGAISWNDVEDKPFGEEPGLVEILPETTLDFEFISLGGIGVTEGQYEAMADIPSFVDGQEYIIVWDGVEYRTTARLNDYSEYILGNQFLSVAGGEDTGEPFGIVQDETYGSYIYAPSESTHTISILTQGTVVKQIDEKFIPDNIARISTATVGQTIAVKAVDENGKPTEWEAVDFTGGGGASGDFSEYEVLVDETITSDEEITVIKYPDIDFSKYNDIVVYFDKAANASNTSGNIKIIVKMLGYAVFNNLDLAGVDAHRSVLMRVLNMGNNNVVSFASVADNQYNNPQNLTCNGIFPLNFDYFAYYDKGFDLSFNVGYIGTCKLKIMAR